MRDLDQIISRIEKEWVQPELGADARRRDRRIELPAAAGFHFTRNLERRAARGVLLLRVVALFHPARVLRKTCEQLARTVCQRKDDVRSRREVRSGEAADNR